MAGPTRHIKFLPAPALSSQPSAPSPRIAVTPAEISDSGCTGVSVQDVTASQVYVTVPVAAPADWIERHRALLTAVGSRFLLRHPATEPARPE
ncbi:DUF5959 family protein [Streptomyces poriticola]|uniref:DUF5959 family protein n=1 Tax=Streptomyces poriticola TaxID=3120506 RepID=UPI0038CD4AE2